MQSTDPLPQVVDPTSQWSLADLRGGIHRCVASQKTSARGAPVWSGGGPGLVSCHSKLTKSILVEHIIKHHPRRFGVGLKGCPTKRIIEHVLLAFWLDSFMSLQHLVSSSLWCSYFLSTLIGSREVTCFWWRSWICHYISDLFALPPVPPRWPVRCSHGRFTGEFPVPLSGKAEQSLEEWWHFGGPCRLWHWGALG